jgi:hypothetical protein
MTDERTLDRLIAHLRAQVAELRRQEEEGAGPDEVADRKRLILRLQGICPTRSATSCAPKGRRSSRRNPPGRSGFPAALLAKRAAVSIART